MIRLLRDVSGFETGSGCDPKQKTADEILKDYEFDVHYYGRGRNHVLSAMEEYAKQESISFFEFKKEYQSIESMNHKHNVTDKIGMISWVGASDEVIWEAYKNNNQLIAWYATK